MSLVGSNPTLSAPRIGLWASFVAGLLFTTTGVLLLWPLPSLDSGATLALAGLTGATLAAEVFTVDFPDRKRISGGYIFPLLASAVIAPQAGVAVAGVAGVVAVLLRGPRRRSALIHGPQLALAAAAATGLEIAAFGRIPLELRATGVLGVLLYAAVYTVVAWALGRIEEALARQGAEYAAVDVLTNVLLAPLPLALRVIYERTNLNGLLLSCLALALLLIVVRAYVNLATLHGELRLAYARLAEQERRLENALQTNREMSQVVSHDLRGPLTSILGYAELLGARLEHAGSEKELQYLASIEGNSRRILGLADKLLDLHRLEEGGNIELVELDPAALVRQLREEVSVQAEQKRIALELDVAPNVPCVRSSEWMLREIAENLVSNAIKYTREAGRVAIRLRPDGHELLLEVEDTGIGIAPEDQARLFTKFFRGASDEVRSMRGAGLGLALTRTMIERLGGRIEVWSELGHGSRFSVHLPLAAPA
jgi:signal transduction histidine kinase